MGTIRWWARIDTSRSPVDVGWCPGAAGAGRREDSEGVEVMDTTVEGGATYEVIAHREVSAEASFWVFEIPALGAVGQAVKLGQVTDEARGIIAVWNEDGPDENSFKVQVRLDGVAESQRM